MLYVPLVYIFEIENINTLLGTLRRRSKIKIFAISSDNN